MSERSEAADFLAKQESELHDFLMIQARKLNNADYDWELPDGYSEDALGFYVMSDAALGINHRGDGAIALLSSGRLVSIRKNSDLIVPIDSSKTRTILDLVVSLVDRKVDELKTGKEVSKV